jgi:hypothetical protein
MFDRLSWIGAFAWVHTARRGLNVTVSRQVLQRERVPLHHRGRSF